MEKLNIIKIPVETYTQDYLDWCKREKIDPDPSYSDKNTFNKKVEGGEIAIAEKINEIVEFINNLKCPHQKIKIQ